MVEGQSVTSYLTTMKEYRSQLERMGEHISLQAATAFMARSNGNWFPPSRGGFHWNYRSSQSTPFGKINAIYCNNCRKEGHAASRCYVLGSVNTRHAPWATTQGQSNNLNYNNSTSKTPSQNVKTHGSTTTIPCSNLANLAKHDKNIVMMAKIDELPSENCKDNILIVNKISALSSIEDKMHIWLLDSGASSHLCGNIELFSSIMDSPPVSILLVNRESFLVNQKGTILLTIQSNMPDANIPDMPITLANVNYVPKLNMNLLLVGQMTNTNTDVNFSKNHSYLSMDGEILAYRLKISNLFTYTTICTSREDHSALYATGLSESLLWHHRLTHRNYHTIEKMAKEDITIGFSPTMKIEGATYTQFPDCPYGKQTCVPFKKAEAQPLEIWDTIVSDLCGPFEVSMNGYKYFVSWIDLRTWYTYIDFLKDKEYATVTASFKHYITWLKK